MDYSKYKKMFIDETMDNITHIYDTLSVFAQNREDQEAIQNLFRFFHSIKGMAASLNYHQIQEISHKLEDLLDGMRSGKIEFGEETLEVLYDGSAVLEKLVRIIEDDSDESVDVTSFINRLVSISTIKKSIVPLPAPLQKKKFDHDLSQNDLTEMSNITRNQYKICITVSKESISPPARAYLLIESFKEKSEILKTIPSFQDISKGNIGHDFILFVATDESEAGLESIITSSIEIEKYTIDRIEVASEERTVELKNKVMRSPKSVEKNKEIHYRKPGTVKIDTPVLDSLIDIVGEMFIQGNQLGDIARSVKSPETVESVNQLEKLVKKLYEEVMTLRLVPLSLLSDMIPRVIREVLRDSDKKVDLEVNGKNIKLDRAIIEKLGDPVIHLIRNSLDHGIETPEERKKAGKPEKARLIFSATKERDFINIELSDDGGGLDPDQIKKKILSKGLATPETLKKAETSEIYNYIWQPGFSTADQVTSISGRGVGMDIVKNVVEGLGGKVSIVSVPGEGCKFQLRVPLTIAIIKTFRIVLEKDIYAIPIGKILHTVELPRSDLKYNKNGMHFYYRDEKIDVYGLKSILKYGTNGHEKKKLIPVLIVDTDSGGNSKAGLIVDSFLSIHDTVVKPLGKPLEKYDIFSGATMSEKGDIILILDVDKLLLTKNQV